MRPPGSADVLEGRRRRALKLLSEGRSLHEVARRIRCAASSVLRWRNAWRRGGEKALQVRPSPGRPRKLPASQRRRLVRLLLKGARAHGYGTDLWTTARIAEVIERHLGVKYHPDHVGRLMHSLGWTHQKPQPGAIEYSAEGSDCRKQVRPLQGWVPQADFPLDP